MSPHVLLSLQFCLITQSVLIHWNLSNFIRPGHTAFLAISWEKPLLDIINSKLRAYNNDNEVIHSYTINDYYFRFVLNCTDCVWVVLRPPSFIRVAVRIMWVKTKLSDNSSYVCTYKRENRFMRIWTKSRDASIHLYVFAVMP